MTPDQLARLALKDLRALAAKAGIAADGKRKAELVAALASPQEAPRREPPPPAQAGASSTPPQAWQPPPPGYGLPIPESYGRDRLVLMPQDPSHLFAYWEVTPATLDRVRAEAGGAVAAVLVVHGQGSEQREVDLGGGNYYLTVAPASAYEAELCLRDAQGRLHRLVVSNRISTPAAGPSWRTDEDWMEVDESFDALLALAGVPGSAGSSGALVGSSGQRFRNARQIHARMLAEGGVASAGGAVAPGPEGGGLGAPSSLALQGGGGGGPSSLALSSGAMARAAQAGLSSGALVSSSALSSRALSSRALSSRSLSSGALVQDAALGPAEPYPVEGVFHAPPTGLPKAAEGVASTPGPPPAAPQPAGAAPPSNPSPTPDPLAFVGAPKPKAQRKPKPPRA